MASFSNYTFVILVLLSIQGICAANVRRSAETTTRPFEDLLVNIKAQMKVITDGFNKFIESKEVEEVRSLIVNKTKEIEDLTKNVVADLRKRYEIQGADLTEKASMALDETTNRLNNALEYFKSQAPGMTDELISMQQKFSETVKATFDTVVDETRTLAKAAEEDINAFRTTIDTMSKSALSQAVDVMKQLQTDFQDLLRRPSS